jgi:hypothetical protein
LKPPGFGVGGGASVPFSGVRDQFPSGSQLHHPTSLKAPLDSDHSPESTDANPNLHHDVGDLESDYSSALNPKWLLLCFHKYKSVLKAIHLDLDQGRTPTDTELFAAFRKEYSNVNGISRYLFWKRVVKVTFVLVGLHTLVL